MPINAFLFDLDVILFESIPDWTKAVNLLRNELDLPTVTSDQVRSYVGDGVGLLLQRALPEGQFSTARRKRFMEIYTEHLTDETLIYPGIIAFLEMHRGEPMAVVTNKPQHLTDPLLATLGLSGRLSCCVSGDTLAQRKPDPAPLLYACDQAGVPPHRAVYVGDAARDIEAGRAAGMSTVVAAYGYIVPGDEPASWNPDAIATDTKELAKMLLKAVNLDT